MKAEDFFLLARLLKERSGLVLAEDKVYLLESRLTPLARQRGLGGLDDLVEAVRRNPDEELLSQITDAMTTNESFFFRDIKPFDNFRNFTLPYLLEARAERKSFRIWCAAASTGQEPYSLAMILRENAHRLQGWRVEILATDLAADVLEKAKAGVYSQFEVQRGLPIQYLMKYFQEKGEMWQIDPAIRAMVQFRRFNLLNSFAPFGMMDVIFCRNVLIYFDQETKKQVLERLVAQMPSDGALYLGAAETVLGITDRLAPMEDLRGIYCRSAA